MIYCPLIKQRFNVTGKSKLEGSGGCTQFVLPDACTLRENEAGTCVAEEESHAN